MMGLHHNYPVPWGAERMEGLTLDLGLDGMFSPLPTDLNVASKEEPEPSWRFGGQSQTQQNSDDPTVLLQSNCWPERKQDMFELSLSYPPVQQQRLINMKVEREDVAPNPAAVFPSLPTDLISENRDSRSRWRNIEFPHKEVDLYGGVVGQNLGVYPDTSAQCSDTKPSRSVPTRVAAAQPQRATIFVDGDTEEDPILLDGDTDDELFLEEEEEDTVEDTRGLTPFADIRGEDGAYISGSQALPLRQIKQHVRSNRIEEQYAYVKPACVPDGFRSYGSKDFETGETYEQGEQGKPPSKRMRGYVDHGWLPSDLLKACKDERENEPQRARLNSELDQTYGPHLAVNAECRDTSEQLQTQKPLIDVNQAILEMPQNTAEAFKELFRLVGASNARASHAVEEIESRRSVTDEVQHRTLPPPTLMPTFFGTGQFGPSESGTQSRSSRTVLYEQNAENEKGASNADVVLYEPKPEPLESWREDISGSVVQVKQEIQHHNVPDLVSVTPVGQNAVPNATGPLMSNRTLILTALHTFEQCRLQILKDPSYGQTSTSTTITDTSKVNPKRLRADLKAACLMRKKGFWLNDRIRPIGHVPGVDVGDCFRYRIEMAVIGLHRAVQAGIAVVPLEHSPYGVTIASSVVIGVSDPYQDDNDMGDTVVYSGQGGLCGKTKESRDQELKRGNLALSNSYNLSLPVRLIRGHKEQNGVIGISYSYDGLYKIIDMNYVNGVNGKKVYKFTMQREAGQAPVYPAPLGSQPPPAVSLPPSQQADEETLRLEQRPGS